jgi:hypothetical protein
VKNKKTKNGSTKITVIDYLKAIKKADREIVLEQQPGFQSTTRIHKSKKLYNRKRNKKDWSQEG